MKTSVLPKAFCFFASSLSYCSVNCSLHFTIARVTFLIISSLLISKQKWWYLLVYWTRQVFFCVWSWGKSNHFSGKNTSCLWNLTLFTFAWILACCRSVNLSRSFRFKDFSCRVLKEWRLQNQNWNKVWRFSNRHSFAITLRPSKK